MECKVYFAHEAVSVDSEIILQVAIKSDKLYNIIQSRVSVVFRSGFPLSIEFSQLSVSFNLKEYNNLVNITNPNQLKFSSNDQRILSFNFVPKHDHVQRILEVCNETSS